MLSIAAVICVCVNQFRYINPFTSTWDQVDFSLGVKRYDLMAMQPHFPGYPFFILGGKLVYLVIKDTSKALVVFNILFYTSALFPIFRICRMYLNRHHSILSMAILYTAGYATVVVNSPMSEGAALAAFWWYIWGLLLALKTKNHKFILLPLAFVSILTGIRLSYFPFVAGIVYLLFFKLKKKVLTFKQALYLIIIGVLMQLIWVGALVISEGSIKGFLKLSIAFTNGHFTDWGGAIETSTIPFMKRLSLFIFNNILWTGISAHSWIITALFAGLVIELFLKRKLVQQQGLTLFYFMFGIYFLWALFAQNIEKARHVLPLAMMMILILCIKSFSKQTTNISVFIGLLLLVAQVFTSMDLLQEQANSRPAVYQMNDYILKKDEPVVLYTWEETRVLNYLNVPYSHKRIETYQLFHYDATYYHNRTILLTDKVVKGFKSQGVHLEGKIKKVATFQSNDIFDPVYNHISLYKWISRDIE